MEGALPATLTAIMLALWTAFKVRLELTLTASVITLPASPMTVGMNGPFNTVEFSVEPSVVSIIYTLKQVISSENVKVVIGFPSVNDTDVCIKLPFKFAGSKDMRREEVASYMSA